MDPERLEELRKQRAKLEEELAKLESEIGKSRPATPPTPVSPRVPALVPLPPPVPSRPIGREAEELFEKLSASEKVGAPSKTGCWVIFSAVLLAVAAIVTLAARMIYK